MKPESKHWESNLRVIWAIFSKDVVEAVKNKTTLTLLISALFVVLMYRALPLLETKSQPMNLLVYDAGNSELVTQLENSLAVKLYTYPTEAKMRYILKEGETPELGLIIPASFDSEIESGQSPSLQALTMHWIAPKDKTRLEDTVQKEIKRITGQDVQLRTEILYMTPEAGGLSVMASLGMIFTVVMIGLTLIPHLMLEEKKSKTMDALLVSPASAWDLVAAKALVGLFYCLLAIGIGLGVYHRLVLHWWLAILAMVCVSMVVIPLGLWLGVRLEDRSQLTIYAWVIILPLFFPMIIMLLEPLFPETVIRISGWFPTSVTLQLLRNAFSQPLDLWRVSGYLLYLLAWIGAGLALVVWQIRQLDKEEESPTANLGQWWKKKQTKAARETKTKQNNLPEPETGARSQSARTFITGSAPKRNSGITRIFAITKKDLREALKNKMMISLIFGTLLLILPNAFLPSLLRSTNKPAAIAYDPGKSETLTTLARRENIGLQIVDSESDFYQRLTESMNAPIGLVIPDNFDELAQKGVEVSIPAAAVRWADKSLMANWAAFYADKLTIASGVPIKVELSTTGMYPSASAGGYPRMVGIILSLGILTLGLAILPLLLVEEREAHTLEALLISPASLSQIITGKALAGMIYTLVVFVISSLVYAQYINNWAIIVLAALTSTFFIASLGLLLGILSNNPSTTGLWSALVILTMLVFVGLDLLNNPKLPGWTQTLLAWNPASIMTRMMTFAMAREIHPASLAFNAGVLIASGLALIGLDTWLIHKRSEV